MSNQFKRTLLCHFFDFDFDSKKKINEKSN